MKICRICKKELENSSFGKNRKNKDGLNTMCKECRPGYIAKYEATCERTGASYQLKRFGLTDKAADTILSSQDGRCAICAGPPTVYAVYVVDYDYDTGKYRGLICQHCESGLGRFKDSTKLMEQARKHIQRSKVSKFRELELKYSVKCNSSEDFVKWILDNGYAVKYARSYGQDVYWTSGDTVIRHRLAGPEGAGEVTVKCRTNKDSTTDRVEIDLTLSERTAPEDVAAFMTMSGFKPSVSLTKTSHIFFVPTEECGVTVVMYEVQDDFNGGASRCFLEIEIDKSADIPVSKATQILKNWGELLEKQFNLVLENLSLYEIYSGKKYQSI